MFWMDNTKSTSCKYVGERAGELGGKGECEKRAYFSILKNNYSGQRKVRTNHLSRSYIMLHAASKSFQKKFCVTIKMNCCPLKLQHQASYINSICVVVSAEVKQSFPQLTRFLPLSVNARKHYLHSLTVRKQTGFIQNTKLPDTLSSLRMIRA